MKIPPPIAAFALALALAAGGCYTADELRARAEAMPDPRQEQVDELWAAIGEVVAEKAWPVELDRREDLLLSTAWMPLEDGRRKRVRFLVLVAPMGVAINATVKYQRPADGEGEGPAEAAWQPDTSEAAVAAAKAEEQALVREVYAAWKE